MVYLNAVLA